MTTSGEIQHILRGALTGQSDAWDEPLANAMTARRIDTPARASMFLATCLYETGGFRLLQENLNYSAGLLLRMWPSRFQTPAVADSYAEQPIKIANRAYASRNGNGDEASGDGWLYRGRGLIQLTGRSNYARIGQLLGLPLEDHPELVERPTVACDVAACFWQTNGCNDYADDMDFGATQGIVNRGNPRATADNMQGRIAWLARIRSAQSLP